MSDLEHLLHSLGLEQYVVVFDREEVDIEAARLLGDGDFAALGIPLGPRRKIQAALKGEQASAATSPAIATAERRQLTVLFCDLVGSTALSGAMDPEALRSLMGRYHEACRVVVEKYAGQVAQYLGDGVMAYFGWPVAHEDDAERALRAGLELVAAVKRVTGAPSALQVRIGVATGPVVVGEGGEESTAGGVASPKLAVGETPNLAARLQGLAAPDEIVASSATRRLAGGVFEVRDLGNHVLKGVVDPVAAWQVVGLKQTEGRFEASRGAEQRLSAFVGREQEVGLLAEKWSQACEGQGQVVLLEGEPGIGKSRITQWLLEHIGKDRHYRLRYQCSPYHAQSAFHPIIEQIERAAKFGPEDGAEGKLDKLQSLLDSARPQSARTQALFGALLGLAGWEQRHGSLNLTPQKQKELTLQALTGHVTGLSEDAPVLLLMEDAHWIDPSTLESLGQSVEAVVGARVLVLITYRPEFKAQWTGLSHVSHVILNRLSPGQTRALAEHVAGGRRLPEEIVGQIVQKTDGIPLFVEELTKAVLEAGLLELDAGANAYRLKGPLSPIAIPATLRDSLTARLDRLSPTKEVAQIGACIGREFGYGLLEKVANLPEAQLTEALNRLTESELVFQKGSPPEASYTFKHALIQDAAYDGLLKSRRAQIHARIAQVLEQHFPESSGSQPEVLAHHYSNAGDSDRASRLWLEAGRRALGQLALSESVAHLKACLREIALLPPSRDRDERELDARTTLGTAWMAFQGWSATELWEAVEPALPIARQLGRARALVPVLWGLWVVTLSRGRIAESMRWADVFRRAGEETGDDLVSMVAETASSATQFWLGNLRQCLEGYSRIREGYVSERHAEIVSLTNHDPISLVAAYAGWAAALVGEDARAISLLQEADAQAEALKHGMDSIMTLDIGALALVVLGDARGAGLRFERAIAIAREKSMDFFEFLEIPKLRLSQLSGVGQHEEAIRQFHQLNPAVDAIEFLITRPQRKADISASLLACGKPQEALQLIDEGFDQVRRDGWQEAYYEADMWRIRGRILCALGAPDEALRAWQEGIRVGKKRGLVRAELMIAVEQARLLEELGKADEAESLLAAALRIPNAAGCRAAYTEATGLLTSLRSAASHAAGERK